MSTKKSEKCMSCGAVCTVIEKGQPFVKVDVHELLSTMVGCDQCKSHFCVKCASAHVETQRQLICPICGAQLRS